MLRHRLTSWGIRLDRARVNAHLLGDPDEEIVEHFERLLGGEAAREAHKPHLVGQAQPVVDAPTVGDLGMVSWRKPDPLGDEVAGIITDGVSCLQTNKYDSTCWPSCHGRALPPRWVKAYNPARNGGAYDHSGFDHGVVL